MAHRRGHRRSLADRYRPQAEAEAALRYAPEFRSLREIALQAADARDATIRSARATGRGLRDTIAAVRPDVRANYDRAGSRLDAQQVAVGSRLSSLGPAADLIRAAAIAEEGAAQTALTTAGTRNLADLDAQRVRAAEGAAFARTQANQQFQSDLSKIARQMRELSGEQGLFTATTLGKLVDDARGRALTRRGQTLTDRRARETLEETKRHNREAEAEARRKRREADKKQRASTWAKPPEQAKAKDGISEAMRHALRMQQTGRPREYVEDLLLTGRPQTEVEDDKTGEKLKVPAVPKLSADYVQAALDLVYGGGYLSRETVKRLHARRIKVKPLGFPTRPKKSTGNFLADMAP